MLQAPFPWFGGKSRAAPLIWPRLGNVANYVEPFAGSLAVLLGRPAEWLGGIETVNDKDAFISNFWRAVQADPDGVAVAADRPVNENDLHARHAWLVGERETLRARLEGDPEFYDAKIAGWWVWGMACWIGGGFCSGDGPWQVVDGQLVNAGNSGQGVRRTLVHLGDSGRGVHRKRALGEWMRTLQARLRRVRVCSGDWTRVCGPGSIDHKGTTAVVLDPPYADTAGRTATIYTEESLSVAHDVREWAIAHGDDSRLRIVLCGYEGEHAMPDSWTKVAWKANGGYGGGNGRGLENAYRERLWFSPHCLTPQATLF